jgi:hypothetical protein
MLQTLPLPSIQYNCSPDWQNLCGVGCYSNERLVCTILKFWKSPTYGLEAQIHLTLDSHVIVVSLF